MCSRVTISKIAQLHTQTYKLISIYAPYFLSSLRTHPLSHPLFAFSFLLRSPSSLAQQQLVVCSNRLCSSPFSLSLSALSASAVSTPQRDTGAALIPPHARAWFVSGRFLKKTTLSTEVCTSVHENVFLKHLFVPRSMCAGRETVWGCMVGRCCRDRWSFWCTIVVLSAFPLLLRFWLSCEDKKHPAGMSTSPGANDGSQRNSCKWLYFIFSIRG